MENTTEKNITENYSKKLESQAELVKKTVEEYKASPSDAVKLKLYQEMDTFLYLSNAVKENPKERSQTAYNIARETALNEAVQQLPE